MLLGLEISKAWTLDPPGDDRWRHRAQFGPERVAVDKLVLRREQQEKSRRITFERQAHPLAEAMDRQVEITRGAPGIVTPLPFGSRTINELSSLSRSTFVRGTSSR